MGQNKADRVVGCPPPTLSSMLNAAFDAGDEHESADTQQTEEGQKRILCHSDLHAAQRRNVSEHDGKATTASGRVTNN